MPDVPSNDHVEPEEEDVMVDRPSKEGGPPEGWWSTFLDMNKWPWWAWTAVFAGWVWWIWVMMYVFSGGADGGFPKPPFSD